MKKKGFTLIELLAVIVILAIIALIATPIVLNAIKNAQKGAAERSAENYVRAVETAVATSLLGEDKIEDGLYTINNEGNITKDGKTYTIEVSGDKPKSDGSIKIENGQVVKSSQTKLTIGDYQVTYDSNNKIVASEVSTSKACTVVDKNDDEINVGNEIACGSEHFYVMSNDGSNITMLAKYNLKVGSIVAECYEETDSGGAYTGEIICPTTAISTTEDGYGLQDEDMKGYVSSGYPYKGTIGFSSSSYWTDTGGNLLEKYGTGYPTYVYDENSNLYQYVENYETYLRENGVSTAQATLMSHGQAISLGCNDINHMCFNPAYSPEYSLEEEAATAPSWVYSTTYWLGSSNDDSGVWYVGSSNELNYGGYSAGIIAGVRPVVTISVSEIK